MGSEYVILNPQEKNPGWVDSLRMEYAPSLTETAPQTLRLRPQG